VLIIRWLGELKGGVYKDASIGVVICAKTCDDKRQITQCFALFYSII